MEQRGALASVASGGAAPRCVVVLQIRSDLRDLHGVCEGGARLQIVDAGRREPPAHLDDTGDRGRRRATGWVHYGNRWYNTTLGRWTQQDTLDAPLDPVNANRYAYAGADPVNNVDPTGRAAGSDIANGLFTGYFGAVVGLVVSGTCFGLATGAAVPIGGTSLAAYAGCGTLGFVAGTAFSSLMEGPF